MNGSISKVETNMILREMKADDAVEILKLLASKGIDAVVDGGWGVDALLGRQTRPHEDLDIAVEHRYVPKLREIFEGGGYSEVPRDDSRDCNFVLGDDKGHLVDVHSYAFDQDGNFVYGVEYKLGDLTGTGTINGYSVKCISSDAMVRFHTGYPVDDNNFKDVKALCDAFNLVIPVEYAPWLEK